MSERQWWLSLQDMAEAVGKVLRYTQGMSNEPFLADVITMMPYSKVGKFYLVNANRCGYISSSRF